MTKSELIERIVTHQGLLSSKDVELAIKTMLEQMSQCLATGDRIEIRGFGSFSLSQRSPRVGRNPKSGEQVLVPGKQVPHFKAGKELRERVDLVGGNDEDAQSSGSSESMPSSMAGLHAMH
jgi:integration host factor subunit beta